MIASLNTKVPYPYVGFGPALSCGSASACTVIGTGSTTDNSFSLVERWDGSSWSIQPRATAFIYGNPAFLNDVACTGPRTCTIVGGFGPPYGAFAERWNGARWSTQAIGKPASAVPESLNSVSCVAARCMAAGYSLTGTVQGTHTEAQTLIEQYR